MDDKNFEKFKISYKNGVNIYRSLSTNSLLLRTPHYELIGSRLVREPDWKWKKQDGGEGHVGTIRKFESFEEVVVVWDNGKGANYRCAGDYDIRILEPSPSGVIHEKIRCDQCGQNPLHRIRWVCASCLANKNKTISLCLKCYHDDKHSVKHQFFRLLTSTSEKILVKSRRKSKKISYKGLYVGARVVRGIDCIRDNQDKDNKSSKGTVLGLEDWKTILPLSAVMVKWDNDRENMYRVGYNGKTDLKCKIDGRGGFYYPDHLPLLGERTIIKNITKNINSSKNLPISFKNFKDYPLGEELLSISKNSSLHSSKENLRISRASSSCSSSVYEVGGLDLNPMVILNTRSLSINDLVNIDLNFEIVQSLRVGHGGWSEEMFECLGNTGQITGIDKDKYFEVTYPSGNKWTCNSAILKLNDQPGYLASEFTELNNIQNSNLSYSHSHLNLDFINLLENNLSSKHNSESKLNISWFNQSTNRDIFEENCFVQVSSDLEVVKQLQYGHGEWKDSMDEIIGKIGRVVRIYDDGDVLVEVNGKNWTLNSLVLKKNNHLKFKLNFASDILQEFVEASANGEREKFEFIIQESKIDLNRLHNGHTALHASCHNGQLKIVEILLKANANIEIEDKDGDNALHHAALGNHVKIVEILFEQAVDKNKFINSRNKKLQSAMHIAVCYEHLEMVKFLVKLGINLNLQDKNGDTPLHDSILIKNDKIINFLLNSNSELTILNNENFNPIQYAALKGNVNAMRLVIIRLIQLKKYWLIDEKKCDGFSVLHIACLNNHFEIVKVLIENGNLNINIKNDSGQTPLHLAIDRLNFDIIKLLCTFRYPTDNKIRCNINEQDRDGDSALHCLLKNFSFSQLTFSNSNLQSKETYLTIACFLIENGADIFLKNKNDQIPFDFCYDFEIVKYLFNFKNGLNKRFENFFINEGSNENRIVKFINEDYDICVLCQKKKRDILLKPCNHILVCNQCSFSCFKCFLCECLVKDTVRIGPCVLCKKKYSSYLFEPCGHMIMCSECAKTIKYCIKCKRLIEQIVSYKEVCFIKNHSISQQIILDLKIYITKLKELNDLKNRATCQFCKLRINNLVFICGHSACKTCGEQLKNCPKCDSIFFKQILLE